MYKTVRKGDASLQYTILPQNEQFYNNPPPPPPPPRSLLERIIVKIYKVYAVVIITMAVCTFLIFMALLPGLFYGSHNSSVTKVSLIDQQLEPKINESQAEKIVGNDDVEVFSTVGSEDSGSGFITELGDQPSTGTSDDVDEIVSTNATTDVIKMTYSPQKIDTSPPPQPTEMNVENAETTSYPSSTPEPLTSTADYEKTSSDESPPASTVKSSTVSSSFKKAKMPRVTLKLRENETIPQMYMKAGIASYKKGNITTSVLAHGLSLEGLIFKTPEGTIKPWSEKWPFSESSTFVQWKRDNEMREQIFAVLVTLMAVSVMIFCVLSLAQLKASRKRWQNVEEPPLKGREDEESEDRSKLLGGEDKEDDKE